MIGSFNLGSSVREQASCANENDCFHAIERSCLAVKQYQVTLCNDLDANAAKGCYPANETNNSSCQQDPSENNFVPSIQVKTKAVHSSWHILCQLVNPLEGTLCHFRFAVNPTQKVPVKFKLKMR